MKKLFSLFIVGSLFFILTGCDSGENMNGTYYEEKSGKLVEALTIDGKTGTYKNENATFHINKKKMTFTGMYNGTKKSVKYLFNGETGDLVLNNGKDYYLENSKSYKEVLADNKKDEESEKTEQKTVNELKLENVDDLQILDDRLKKIYKKLLQGEWKYTETDEIEVLNFSDSDLEIKYEYKGVLDDISKTRYTGSYTITDSNLKDFIVETNMSLEAADKINDKLKKLLSETDDKVLLKSISDKDGDIIINIQTKLKPDGLDTISEKGMKIKFNTDESTLTVENDYNGLPVNNYDKIFKK